MNGPSEVQLYLLRHAHAGDPFKWSGPDDKRPLSEKGRLQSERLGIFLARARFQPDAIVSSPKIRAIETASLVAAASASASFVDLCRISALSSSRACITHRRIHPGRSARPCAILS